ncbi:hypothetical protein GW17_00045115, partial [Ensete ventricosum]
VLELRKKPIRRNPKRRSERMTRSDRDGVRRGERGEQREEEEEEEAMEVGGDWDEVVSRIRGWGKELGIGVWRRVTPPKSLRGTHVDESGILDRPDHYPLRRAEMLADSSKSESD